ncbi:MAG: hypothetical protein LBL65_00170 [Campylobacteraceae bacterium]|jgi:hypothetical protein|nr:hypothetical protein [Campylobacteraceae bacterium]
MSSFKIFVDDSTLTRFGFNGTNYCGPDWTAGVFDSSGKLATEDGSRYTTSVDKACKDHDDAYELATNATDILIADLQLMADVAGLYTQGKIESPYDLALSVGIFAAFAVKTVLWDLPKAFIDLVQDAYEMIKDAAIGIYDYFSNSSSSENSFGLGFNDESFWGDYYGATNGQTKQITVIALKSEGHVDYDELSKVLGFSPEAYTYTNINQAYGGHIHSGGITGVSDEALYLPLSEEYNAEQATLNFPDLSYDTVTVEIPIDMDPWGYDYDSSSSMYSYQTPAYNPYPYDYWDYVHNNIFSQNMLSVEEDLRWIEEQARLIELNTMLEYNNALIEYLNNNEHIDDTQTDGDLFAPSENPLNSETVEYIRIDIIDDVVSVVNLKSYLGEDLEEIFELDINAEFRATYAQEELLYAGDSFYMPADRRSSILESDTLYCYLTISQDTITISNDDCPSGWDPLVLDLNGDSQISFVELDKSNVFFDLNADGISKHTAWIDKDDGFIVYDENGNGKIDNINELFGNDTIDGFANLKNRIDSNGDGIIDVSDEKFNDLKVWQDKNQDGMSQKDELFTLDELGITEIRTSNTLVDNNEQITRVTNEGTFVKNSEEHYMADVIFEYDPYASANKSFETYSGSFLTSNDINRIIQDINSFVVDNGTDIRNDNGIKNNDAFMQIVMSGWN